MTKTIKLTIQEIVHDYEQMIRTEGACFNTY